MCRIHLVIYDCQVAVVYRGRNSMAARWVAFVRGGMRVFEVGRCDLISMGGSLLVGIPCVPRHIPQQTPDVPVNAHALACAPHCMQRSRSLQHK